MTSPEISQDRTFLLRAAQLSHQHMEAGAGGPFGAVIVKDGVIIGEGWNKVISTNDPTAHAEVSAIRQACETLGVFSLEGATIYSSCEPCPMCFSAIYWARLDRLVYANTCSQAANIGFDDAFIYDEIVKERQSRKLPSHHLPLPEAELAFTAWVNKTDRTDY